jgi:hypothetical protein
MTGMATGAGCRAPGVFALFRKGKRMAQGTGTYHNNEYLASVITLSVVLVLQKASDLIL